MRNPLERALDSLAERDRAKQDPRYEVAHNAAGADIFKEHLARNPNKHRCVCGRIYDDRRDAVCPRCGSAERQG